MPTLLRVLPNRKLGWGWEDALPWLEHDDIPADPLGQITTYKNTLSVFEVNDDPSRIERVAVALAAGKQKLDDVEYIVFDQSILDEVGIVLDNKLGKTCDPEVNDWHRDMKEVSANKLVSFAKKAVPALKPNWVLAKKIRQLLVAACRERKIELAKLGLSSEEKAKLKVEIEQGAI